MPTDDERREVARRLRGNPEDTLIPHRTGRHHGMGCHEAADRFWNVCDRIKEAGNYDIAFSTTSVLADLIEPSYKPDTEYEAWYNSLSHFGDERGGPSTIRELIEEIVWTALTVDLGPNGNTDSTGVDEDRVYTDKLFAEWEREALRLSGSIDRDALLALADDLDRMGDGSMYDPCISDEYGIARRIREALGVDDG